MKEYKKVLENIEKEVKGYFEEVRKKERFQKVSLMSPFYDHKEVMQVVDSLLKKEITLNFSEGNKVQEFENKWSEFIGCKEGVMVNSGSSANLIGLNVLSNHLTNNGLVPGSEVITPALTWTTTVSPIWNLNCIPVFVDVDEETLTMDPKEIEKAITEKTRAIMPVHLLGHPCKMDEIMDIAKKNNLYVIEDCCEAHGAEFNGKKVGSFGDLSTFSFFFSHHLTTLEGGMLVTNNLEFAELARIMRSQGVMRNCKSEEYKDRYHKDPKYEKIQKAYLFANIGFNLRPTQINGGFGLEQLKKFDQIQESRTKNAEFFVEKFRKFEKWISMPKIKENMKHAWFAIPIAVNEDAPFSRRELESFLNGKKIETRQIMAGDITIQPAFEKFNSRVIGSLPITKKIHDNSFFFGNHPLIKDIERSHIIDSFDEFLGKFTNET